MHHHAGFELPCMITGLIEVRFRVDAIPPVHSANENSACRLQLANHGTKIVCSMAVENHELFYSLALERPRNVAEYGGLSARIHVDAKPNVELAGVDSIRNHRK